MNLKKELKKIGLGLIFIICFYWAITYFQLSYYWVFGLLLTFSTFMMVKGGRFTIKGFFVSALYLGALLGALYYIKGLGVYGYAIGILIICGSILWSKRKDFVSIKQQIEEMIWGKPLKDFMANKERPPKLKVTLLKQG